LGIHEKIGADDCFREGSGGGAIEKFTKLKVLERHVATIGLVASQREPELEECLKFSKIPLIFH
jgi:hypothetical protein